MEDILDMIAIFIGAILIIAGVLFGIAGIVDTNIYALAFGVMFLLNGASMLFSVFMY